MHNLSPYLEMIVLTCFFNIFYCEFNLYLTDQAFTAALRGFDQDHLTDQGSEPPLRRGGYLHQKL